MLHIVEDLAGDWRRLDERLEAVSTEIAQLAHADEGAMRLMSVPGGEVGSALLDQAMAKRLTLPWYIW